MEIPRGKGGVGIQKNYQGSGLFLFSETTRCQLTLVAFSSCNYPMIFLTLLSELWRNEKMTPACLQPPALTCQLLIDYEYFALISIEV